MATVKKIKGSNNTVYDIATAQTLYFNGTSDQSFDGSSQTIVFTKDLYLTNSLSIPSTGWTLSSGIYSYQIPSSWLTGTSYAFTALTQINLIPDADTVKSMADDGITFMTTTCSANSAYVLAVCSHAPTVNLTFNVSITELRNAASQPQSTANGVSF